MGQVLYSVIRDVYSLDWGYLMVHGGMGSCRWVHPTRAERGHGMKSLLDRVYGKCYIWNSFWARTVV